LIGDATNEENCHDNPEQQETAANENPSSGLVEQGLDRKYLRLDAVTYSTELHGSSHFFARLQPLQNFATCHRIEHHQTDQHSYVDGGYYKFKSLERQ
jgi:hypothetical protein